MRLRTEAHRVCVVIRNYPTTSFWLLTCCALAAGVQGATSVLASFLVAQLGVIVHIVHRMWAPAVLISLARPGQPPTLLPVQRLPHSSERRHRHARH